MSKPNVFVRFLGGIWQVLNTLRRVLHLLLLLVIFGLLLVGMVGTPVRVPSSAALILDPEGELVEQLAGDPLERALGELQGDGVRQVLVQDLVESLEAAATDDRIKAVVLRLELLDAAGLPRLQAVAAALGKVREAGKKVIAIGDSFDQGQYYLAAHADEVYLNDLGAVYVDGFGYYRTFFKSALDKLRVDLNVFRVGEYKSFVEPFIRDDMSAEDKAASRQWLQAMWTVYQRDVAGARKLSAQFIDEYANEFAARLQDAGGSASRVALEGGLVDKLMSRQEFRDHMIGVVGEMEGGDGEFSQIDYRSYLSANRKTPAMDFSADQVGVIVASGQIVDGQAPPGTIGGDSLAALVQQAAVDDAIKAVVLRVDSPGGSMFASEVVLDELRALQDAGKPLVVSMGTLAASGGYYISMFADEIWASESTITGSIGVGALVPTFDRGLDALGIHVDGIGTTELSGQLRLDRPLGEDARRILDSSVQDAYRIFVDRVAEAREMEFAQADEIARGRVWIGSDAQQLGLVDTIGDLSGAIDAAAGLAGLESGAYGVEYLEPELPFLAQLLRDYAIRVTNHLAATGLRLNRNRALEGLLATGERQWTALRDFNDPRGLYYLCGCDVR
ncbi:MAG: signal peptide peptidase SppA [Gammaproteobacteria bacterium]|nr:signal peptide peptidase SppA [Gammaproteobacteria bacterium]